MYTFLKNNLIILSEITNIKYTISYANEREQTDFIDEKDRSMNI